VTGYFFACCLVSALPLMQVSAFPLMQVSAFRLTP